MSSTELRSLVEQYREAQQLIEAAQAELETIRAQVMTEMDCRGVAQLDAGTHRVRLQEVTTSRLDSKAMRATVPDLAARFLRHTTTRRFTVA